MIHSVKPETLKEWLDKGTVVLVDVREPSEYDAEHIPGSILHPTSTFDVTKVPNEILVVFHCKSGKRSFEAASKFSHFHDKDAFHLEGGILAWKAAGYPTKSMH